MPFGPYPVDNKIDGESLLFSPSFRRVARSASRVEVAPVQAEVRTEANRNDMVDFGRYHTEAVRADFADRVRH
jgi:hypothetical protein